MIICFAGIFITQRSGVTGFVFKSSHVGLLCGLGGTIAAAAAYNCIRKIGVSEDPNVILIYFSIVTIPISILILFITGGFAWPSPMDWFYLFCMGALTQAAQFYMTIASQNEKVGTIAIFTNMGIIYAIINGMIFFNEIPTAIAWLGVSIVISGLLLNIFSARILAYFKP